MKTKEVIVRETARFYNLKNRSVNRNGDCLYNGPDGKKCAVGRFLTSEALEKIKNIGEGEVVTSLPNSLGVGNIDFILKEECRWKGLRFWADLQFFHDCIDFWNEEGVSRVGKDYALSFFGVKL